MQVWKFISFTGFYGTTYKFVILRFGSRHHVAYFWSLLFVARGWPWRGLQRLTMQLCSIISFKQKSIGSHWYKKVHIFILYYYHILYTCAKMGNYACIDIHLYSHVIRYIYMIYLSILYIYICTTHTRRDLSYLSLFGISLCSIGNDGAGHGDLWLWLAACLWWVLSSRLCKQDSGQASRRLECNRSFKLGQQLYRHLKLVPSKLDQLETHYYETNLKINDESHFVNLLSCSWHFCSFLKVAFNELPHKTQNTVAISMVSSWFQVDQLSRSFWNWR